MSSGRVATARCFCLWQGPKLSAPVSGSQLMQRRHYRRSSPAADKRLRSSAWGVRRGVSALSADAPARLQPGRSRAARRVRGQRQRSRELPSLPRAPLHRRRHLQDDPTYLFIVDLELLGVSVPSSKARTGASFSPACSSSRSSSSSSVPLVGCAGRIALGRSQGSQGLTRVITGRATRLPRPGWSFVCRSPTNGRSADRHGTCHKLRLSVTCSDARVEHPASVRTFTRRDTPQYREARTESIPLFDRRAK